MLGVAGAAVLVCLIAVWWRSRFRGTYVGLTWGSIEVVHGHVAIRPYQPAYRMGLHVWNLLGRESLPLRLFPHYVYQDGAHIVIPISFVLMAVGLATLLMWRPWIVARRREGRCDACGYDLTGNVSGICPECGRAFTRLPTHPIVRIAQKVRTRRFWTHMAAGILVAAMLFFSLRGYEHRVRCAATVHHISREFYCYASDYWHDDFFPSEGVDWRREIAKFSTVGTNSLVCPAAESDQHSYIYVPGYGSAGCNPNQIILFDKPSNHLIGGHVLYVDSSVAWFFEPEYSRIISTVTRPDGTKVWPASEE